MAGDDAGSLGADACFATWKFTATSTTGICRSIPHRVAIAFRSVIGAERPVFRDGSIEPRADAAAGGSFPPNPHCEKIAAGPTARRKSLSISKSGRRYDLRALPTAKLPVPRVAPNGSGAETGEAEVPAGPPVELRLHAELILHGSTDPARRAEAAR